MLVHHLLSDKNQMFEAEVIERGFQDLAELLPRLRARCAELGAKPVMLVFPDANRLAGRNRSQPLDEHAAALARANELEPLELLPALEPLYAARARRPILAFYGHYAATANRAMGAYLAERLLALGVPE